MIMPTGASSFKEAMIIGTEVYHTLKSVIKKKSGHSSKVKIATDVAASEFYDAEKKVYDLDFKNPDSAPEMKKTAAELVDYYKVWLAKYPLASLEDPFDQDDWDAYSLFTKEVGGDVQIVGDDLLVTNPNRIKKSFEVGACNALLCKVNQIGSVTESIEAVNMCQSNGWGVMVSHRSGETEDSFIADLVAGGVSACLLRLDVAVVLAVEVGTDAVVDD